mmetsp:Transcript_3877/g.6136  ORF Transcript_3877/g.6136 Transcript_3877/m.6136 type:complete len:139 (-) Transcript_3877:219-635(-)
MTRYRFIKRNVLFRRNSFLQGRHLSGCPLHHLILSCTLRAAAAAPLSVTSISSSTAGTTPSIDRLSMTTSTSLRRPRSLSMLSSISSDPVVSNTFKAKEYAGIRHHRLPLSARLLSSALVEKRNTVRGERGGGGEHGR